MCSLAWFMVMGLLFGCMFLTCLPIIAIVALIMFGMKSIKGLSKKGGDKNEEP